MQKSNTCSSDSVLHPFIEKHRADVIGILHGFDRLRLQGTLRALYSREVMENYLGAAKVLWKDFKSYVMDLTGRIRQTAEDLAQRQKRPLIYLSSSSARKEDYVRQIAKRDQIRSGLVTVLSCVEPCRTYFMRGNRHTRKLELRLEPGKCIHLYFYLIHPLWGWMYLRLQTWFPFLVHIGINGREWLARQMDQAGLKYRRQDNCFTRIADLAQAQALMDAQLQNHWPSLCNQLIEEFHPLHQQICRPMSLSYYWTVGQSEYASDVIFRSRARLLKLYPGWLHHAIMTFGCQDVLRFFGRRGSPEITTDLRACVAEGIRIKHRLKNNSIKLYDKANNLRPEVTINQPEDFCVYRAAEGDPEKKLKWLRLRRGLADLHRRADVCRAANLRYLSALAAVNERIPLAQEAATVCQPVRKEGRRYRALNPFNPGEAQLLSLVKRGEWTLNGFRNRDLRAILFPQGTTPKLKRRAMQVVSRKLALLRAHGLIAKVPRTHRYILTQKGHRVITALLAARQADVQQLTKLAA